ncbi:MAG: MarR family winged helix-turn-helix transcriptional regulator [Pseudonocardia sp.]|nr:MarR family winged helix-turn-helix transcriptional regulator [Pseudonocardia sp.]
MITESTAGEVADVVYAVARLSRIARPAPGSVTGPELPIWHASMLTLLAHQGERRLGCVAGDLDVDPSVVSRRVVALSELGHVGRRPDPEDRRAQLLVLTEAGRAALAEHRRYRNLQLAAALEDLDDAEVRRLAIGFRGVVDQLIGEAVHGAGRQRRLPAPVPAS